jgi:hypothetical protein
MAALELGELVTIGATFIEDRGGRAIVRLPNGSKTTIDYDALRPVGGSVNFVRAIQGTGETAWCGEQDCAWSYLGATRTAAEDEYIRHLEHRHPTSLRNGY